jgi:hypothetical protein
MVNSLVVFPCGEFRPGEEPRPGTGIPNSIPPIYIPDPPVAGRPFQPTLPPGDRIPPVIVIPPGGGGGGGGGGGQGGGHGPGPALGDPGISASAPTTPRYSKCQAIPEFCPPPATGTYVRTLKRIRRGRVSCNSIAANNDLPRSRLINQTQGYNGAADNLCIEDTPANITFFNNCLDSIASDCVDIASNQVDSPRTPGRFVSDSIDTPPGVFSEPPRQVDSQASVKLLMDSIDSRGERRVGNSQGLSQSITKLIPTKEVTTFDLNNEDLRRFSASSTPQDNIGLFDETYNFFRTSPNTSTRLVGNTYNLDVFNTLVAEEVYYFLQRQQSTLPWNESMIDGLTNDKIIISLSYSLLAAFNNIHSIGSTPINLDFFITTVKSHLMAGTLDEFDPNYFLFIYNTQINDGVTNIPQEGESKRAIQIALGIFATSSVSPDPRLYSNMVRDEFRRMRVLLTDIEANVPTLQIDGVDETLYLNNAGIPTEQVLYPSSFTNIGDGAGYYFSSLYIDDTTYPLESVNFIASANYLQPFTRYTVLRILGTDIGINITASSDSNHEFTTSYDPSADLTPMYLKINFETIGDKLNPNSVINILSATYSRITDDEAINHSRNYAFNTVKVNLDYRDPLIHYARDTSTISYEQDDFNLRSFDENRSLFGSSIILRNMPAAIILTPGLGSAHNPFNGKSKLVSFEGSAVTRSINMSPSFDINNTSLIKPHLDSSNTYYSIGTPYFGMYERDYDQDYHGNLLTYSPVSRVFDRSYFFSGNYSQDQPESSQRERPLASKMVLSTVDRLAALSGVEDLTWWDVFRRQTLNEIGEYVFSDPITLNRSLASGWRSGIHIKNVLARAPVRPSGIPDDTTIDNDTIIINPWDR